MLTQLKKLELAGVLLWSFIIVCFAFNEIALQSGHVMISSGGDGAKNYFTYLYHSLYESGVWFNGMNYPYGEHMVFTDLQPLLSLSFICAKTIFPGLGIHSALSLMHGTICLSFMLAIFFNYRILRFYHVPFIVALAAASCITFLSPQILRVSGHFALAYPSFSAMLFYFTIKYNRFFEKKYALYIFLLGCIMYFLHPYYLALAIVWIGFYSVSFYLSNSKSFKEKSLNLIPMWIGTAMMIAIPKLFMSLTDPVKDRPVFPDGAISYGAKAEEMLSSVYSIVWQWIKRADLVGTLCTGGEGFAYPGLVCICIIAIGIIVFAVRLIKKGSNANFMVSVPTIWIWMALFLLLFGMGVPFVWNMEWLLNYLSYFRQFRSLGRFIWLFYQVITILSVILLYRSAVYFGQKSKLISLLVLIIPMSIWLIEVGGYVRYIRQLAKDTPENYQNYFSKNANAWPNFLKDHGYKSQDFQAILVLPYIHIGSEKWWVGNIKTFAMNDAYSIAFKTKIPIVDVMMSRTGWAQTAQQVRIAGGIYADKPLLKVGNRPILVLVKDFNTITNDEAWLIKSSANLGFCEGYHVFVLQPDKVNKLEQEQKNNMLHIAKQMRGVDTVLQMDNSFYYVDHFEQQKNENCLWGKGALGIRNEQQLMIANLDLKPIRDSQLYEISIWTLLSKQDFRSANFFISLQDSSGNEISRQDIFVNESTDNNGMWFRGNSFFIMPANCRKIHFQIYHDDKLTYLAIDELMIRPASSTIISKNLKGQIMVNNHLLKHSLQ